MNQGDIIITNFPFTNLSATKIRPAVVLSNVDFNQKKNLLVAAISTQEGITEFSLSLGQSDLENGNLKKNSFIRLQNIFTLEKKLVHTVVAKLSPSKITSLRNKLISFL